MEEQEVLVSDETVNEHNLRIRATGGDFSRFNLNPIMLYNHIRVSAESKTDILPIGNWSGLRVDSPHIYGVPHYDMEDEFSARIGKKFKGGFIRSFSMGINPVEVSYDGEDENGEKIYWVEKWQLMEISTCDIPSNKNTVKFYNSKFEPIELKAVINMAVQSSDNTKIKQMDKQLEFVPVMLGLNAGASDTAVRQEMDKLLKLKTVNLTLTTENAALKAQMAAVKEQEIVNLVQGAIDEGKILATSKDAYIALCQADLKNAKKVLGAMQVQVKLSDVPKKKINLSTGEDSMKYEGMTFSEMQKKASGKLIALKSKDFATFNALYKAEYRKDYKS